MEQTLGKRIMENRKKLGLTQDQLRSHSHRPQDFYGQPHFMPSVEDGETVLRLNRVLQQLQSAILQEKCFLLNSKLFFRKSWKKLLQLKV